MKKCKVIGCNDKHYCKGLCCRHYNQQVRGTLKVPTIDSLLEELNSYSDIIHYQALNAKSPEYRKLFILIESIMNH